MFSPRFVNMGFSHWDDFVLLSGEGNEINLCKKCVILKLTQKNDKSSIQWWSMKNKHINN